MSNRTGLLDYISEPSSIVMNTLSWLGIHNGVSAIACVLLFSLTTWLVSVFLDRWRNPIPTPFPFPFVKHFPYIVVSVYRGEFMDLLDRWSDRYREIGMFRLDALTGDRIVVIDREFARYLLLSPNTKYARDTKFFRGMLPALQQGLFTADGKHHVWQKKLMSPLFTAHFITKFTECMNSYADTLLEKWERKSQGGAGVIVQDDLDSLALDVIGECAFGYKFNALTDGKCKVRAAFVSIMRGRTEVIPRLLYGAFPVLKRIPFSRFKQVESSFAVASKVIDDIIQRYRDQEPTGIKSGKSLLATLISTVDQDTGTSMSNSLLSSNIFTFLISGQETTSVSIMWTLYCLAKNPEEQQKVRKEIRSVLGSSTLVTSKEYEKMPYLDAVIKESMRLYPAGPAIFRKAIVDDTHKGMHIKKGTVFVILSSWLHVDPKWWREPTQFRPERFLLHDDAEMRREGYFLPFGAGPSMCIGAKFALMEMKIVLCKLLNSLDFRVSDSTRFGRFTQTAMKATPPIPLIISKAQPNH